MDTHDVPTTRAVGKNRQWILDARPVGKLTGKEFRWHEASIPQPSEGQVLVRNLWLSVDPAQRIWMWRDSYIPKIPIGEVEHAPRAFTRLFTGENFEKQLVKIADPAA